MRGIGKVRYFILVGVIGPKRRDCESGVMEKRMTHKILGVSNEDDGSR